MTDTVHIGSSGGPSDASDAAASEASTVVIRRELPVKRLSVDVAIDPDTHRALAGTYRDGRDLWISVSKSNPPGNSIYSYAAKWDDLDRPESIDLCCRICSAAGSHAGPIYTVSSFDGPGPEAQPLDCTKEGCHYSFPSNAIFYQHPDVPLLLTNTGPVNRHEARYHWASFWYYALEAWKEGGDRKIILQIRIADRHVRDEQCSGRVSPQPESGAELERKELEEERCAEEPGLVVVVMPPSTVDDQKSKARIGEKPRSNSV